MLWNRSLVMYDKETNSYWSHILGRAMQGEHQGVVLEQLPCVITDWETWRRDHPQSTVLWMSRTRREYRREFYRKPEQFVLGIAEGQKAQAWGFDQLQKQPAVNAQWQSRPVLVAFDQQSVTARMYSRKVGEKVLEFKSVEGKLTDRETGSRWEFATGKAVEGPMKGKYLEAMPAIMSYRKTWRTFYPDSR